MNQLFSQKTSFEKLQLFPVDFRDNNEINVTHIPKFQTHMKDLTKMKKGKAVFLSNFILVL